LPLLRPQSETREHPEKPGRVEELRDGVHVRRLWGLVLAAGLPGVVSGIWQTVDRIAWVGLLALIAVMLWIGLAW
jgi:hypothetical protein